MKMHFAAASLVIMALCGTMSAQTKSDQAPSGTVVEKQHGDTNEVQPAPEKIRITPDVVRASQQKLTEEGYKPGTPDGKMGPVTRGAVRKYQQDKGLKVTGTLDESTLSHLNVGGGKVMATVSRQLPDTSPPSPTALPRAGCRPVKTPLRRHLKSCASGARLPPGTASRCRRSWMLPPRR